VGSNSTDTICVLIINPQDYLNKGSDRSG